MKALLLAGLLLAQSISLYELVRRDTYSAYVDERFVKAPKYQIVPSKFANISLGKMKADALDKNDPSARCHTAYFCRDEEDVGKTVAVFGYEICGSKLK